MAATNPLTNGSLPFLQNITDEDVLALVNDEVHQPPAIWQLQDVQVRRTLLPSLPAHLGTP